LASSKQTEDDNSPNSGLGGDSNTNETETLGKSLFNTPSRAASHAVRNSAKGLTSNLELTK